MFGILGGIYVDYKKEIIEMLDKIKVDQILRYIYIIISDNDLSES